MKLFNVCTKGLGSYYVLTTDPTSAQIAIEKMLNDQEYGYSHERVVVHIDLVATEPSCSLSNKSQPFLSDENKKLIIVKNWESLSTKSTVKGE